MLLRQVIVKSVPKTQRTASALATTAFKQISTARTVSSGASLSASQALLSKPFRGIDVTSRGSTMPSTSINSVISTSVTFLSRRHLFIQTQHTPNPRSLKFLPGKLVLPEGGPVSASFDSANKPIAKRRSSLAYTLLMIEGVTNVMFGSDFVTVTIEDGVDWMVINPQVYAAISEAYASEQPLLRTDVSEEDAKAASSASSVIDSAGGNEEVIALINEIIDRRVRPSVMEDGGDVEFIKFDENRIVWLKMMGSCSGCPSSGATLKQGIQNMLMHYVEEVAGVEEWVDGVLETVSAEELKKLEDKLEKAKETEASSV